MQTTKRMYLRVTSSSGNIVTPMLTYDYKCKNCGLSTQLCKISGLGLPAHKQTTLFLETPEILESECRDCGMVESIHTELSETDPVEVGSNHAHL